MFFDFQRLSDICTPPNNGKVVGSNPSHSESLISELVLLPRIYLGHIILSQCLVGTASKRDPCIATIDLFRLLYHLSLIVRALLRY